MINAIRRGSYKMLYNRSGNKLKTLPRVGGIRPYSMYDSISFICICLPWSMLSLPVYFLT